MKISGGGRDADGVQAHFEYIDRHGKLDIETDHGEVLRGKTAATEIINDWALDYGAVPGTALAQQSRPRWEATTATPGVEHRALDAGGYAAREGAEGGQEIRSRGVRAPASLCDDPARRGEKKHGAHPHVHLVVKAEHEYDGSRLNPRKADLQRWRERFAEYLTELGVAATATRREDRGFVKTNKKTPIYRAAQRKPKDTANSARPAMLTTPAGDSVFMRRSSRRSRENCVRPAR